MSTHSAIAATSKGVVALVQVPTEAPAADQISLKVEYAGLVTLDTYMLDIGFAVGNYPAVLGFNAAGTVAQVGSNVKDLAVGDRVAAFGFGEMGATGFKDSKSNSMQEYAVIDHSLCTKVPSSLSLESATTIPDNFVTAFYAFFSTDTLGLPIPTTFPPSSLPSHSDRPILIYGSGSSVGQYAIQLLHLAGYTNIITTASPRHHDYLKSLAPSHLSTFDYNSPNLAKEIETAAGGGNISSVLDCVAAEASLKSYAGALTDTAKVALLLPIKKGNTIRADGEMFTELPSDMNPFKASVGIIGVQVFGFQAHDYLKQNLLPRILSSLLEQGTIKPNKVRLLDETQGTLLERVEVGLDLLRNSKVSGEKIVVKVGK